MKISDRKPAVEFIKHKIQVLNLTVLLVVFIAMLLIVRFMYEFMGYIPVRSVIVMLVAMAGLGIASVYLSKATAGKAISAIEQYSEKLVTLLTATKGMHETGYSDVLLESIIDGAMRITGADGGSLLLVEGDWLAFKIAKGTRGAGLAGLKIPLSQGIAGWVVERGKPVRINDAREDIRFYPEVDRITSYETKSVLCVPLRIRAETIGALELVNKEGGEFTPDDEELLSYFAGQAALSMEKTKFYDDEKNYKIHLTNILIEAVENISEKRGHARRVARYSLMMAGALGLAEEQKNRLYQACMLDDIGFLKVRLDEVKAVEDYRVHSKAGYEMLQPINFYADIAPLVLHHHERWDGTGYPSGLKGQEIPLASRIIAVAEAFDAMTSKDSYKRTGKLIAANMTASVFGFNGAVSELRRNAGMQFDPEVVTAFLNSVTEEEMAA